MGTMSVPITQSYNMCPLDDQRFKDLITCAKETPPNKHMCEMTVTFKHIRLENKLTNPKKDWFTISNNTAADVTEVLQLHNPKCVPTATYKGADGSSGQT